MSDAHRKLSILPRVYILIIPSSESDTDSHRNEGFLKSVWHKFTDSPGHKEATEQAKDEGKAKDEEKDKKTTPKDKEKKG